MNIYITSLASGDGKTIISAGIAAVMQSLGYNTGVYKPIQINSIDKGEYLISPDLAFVKMVDPYIKTHSTYMFKSKAVPIAAAALEHSKINIAEISKDYNILTKQTDMLITEACGNLMTPLNNDTFSYHIPIALNIPIVIIANPSFDSVAHFINELNISKTLGLDIGGIIINRFSVYSDSLETKTFPNLIEKYSDVKILGLIRNFKGKSVKTNILINEILNGIELESLFRIKIPKLNI